MNREYHKWFSPALNREMELLVFGHGGARVLVFPTSMGRFYDWEDRGLIRALREHLERGWVQLYCVDSVDAESWYAKAKPPAARAARHVEYDRYLLEEVLPFSRSKNDNPYLIVTGASFGAYHAVTFAFRHPEVSNRVIGMSGLYDIRRLTNGYDDEAMRASNPCALISHEHDPQRLEQLRRLDIILAIGRDDPSCWSNTQLSRNLWGKGIWHALRLWDGWAHDWPYWEQMLIEYIGGAD